MTLVTLIGEKIAIEDNEFMYLGPNNDCKDCKLKTVCFNLKPGRSYKIKKVRDKKHNCKIHEGTVIVVEAEELPITTAITESYKEGEKTKIEKIDCENIGCKNYNLCKVKLQKDKVYTIEKIFENIDCPIENKLYKVELRD